MSEVKPRSDRKARSVIFNRVFRMKLKAELSHPFEKGVFNKNKKKKKKPQITPKAHPHLPQNKQNTTQTNHKLNFPIYNYT